VFKQSIKIGIDLLWVRHEKVGGTESYIRSLLRGIEMIDRDNDYYLFISLSNADSFGFINVANFHKVICSINSNHRWMRILYVNSLLPLHIKKLKLDIMFFPTYMRPIWKLNTYTVSNVHDLQYLYYPEYFSLLKRMLFNIFYSISLRKSDKVVAISEFVRKDIMKYFGSSISNIREKIVVIHNPIAFGKIQGKDNSNTVLRKWNLKTKTFIYTVSSMFPHKNLTILLRAFALLKIKKPGLKLVISGIGGPSKSEFEKISLDLSIAKDVINTGFISDYERDIFYANCLCFAFPSIFEGFGMPAVEALWFGVPVVASDIPVMREVTQNKAIYVSDFSDVEEWISAISRVIADYERIITKPGNKDLSDEYSIESVAKRYIDLFQSCADNRRVKG